MRKSNFINKTKTILKSIFSYFNDYRLIYVGIIICNLCCFNLYRIFVIDNVDNPFFIILLMGFFLISFLTPLTLGVIFVIKSFIATSKIRLLSNIIHSYLGAIIVFASLYYQCSVLGDFNDAVMKRINYESQVKLKQETVPDLLIMRIADKRAFNGIKARIWSGFDYPASGLLFSPEHNPDSWHRFTNNTYEDLSIEQIERIVKNSTEYSKVIEYQKKNVIDVYVDCLYFSVICIATVGFGDITPNLWYTKLFTSLEILIGISIFVFAIGMMFNRWNISKTEKLK